MKAILLAAGYGTRLGLNMPKHLVKVAGKEMMIHLLEKLDVLPLDEIYIVTNDWGYEPTKECLAKYHFQKPIQVLNDGTTKNDARLGTLGDILFLIQQKNINDDLLIVAGDNLFEYDLGEFILFFKEKSSDALILVDVKDKEIAKRMGVAAVDGEGKIVSFVEKPEHPPSTLAGTLCYAFTSETLEILRQYKQEGHNLDKAGSFIAYLHKIKPVYGWVTDKAWFDIGNREQLQKANEYFKK